MRPAYPPKAEVRDCSDALGALTVVCQCAHWGYIISGTMRVHGAGGARDYEAGETYYWEPGHNLEAVTAAEYVEITRSDEYDMLMAHCKRVISD
jgi:hypothetical protein